MRSTGTTRRRLAATSGVVVLGAALAACGSGTSTTATPSNAAVTRAVGPTGGSSTVVPVVAGENFWGNITSQIGGAHVTVTSIISDPNADPHTYEVDPRDATAVSRASFVVLNGVGYDDFASKLLSASPNPTRTVISIDKLVRITGSNPNPHLWYNPTYVKQASDAITAALAKADPADSASFTAHERTFLTAYQPYVDELAKIKAKYAGTKISYTERVPGYLVLAAGLELGTPASFSQAVEDGTDPSPQDTAVFDADIKSKAAKVLLYNGQVTDAQTTSIKALATSSGVPIVGVTETIPANYTTFQAWQIAQADQIFTALGG